MFNDPDNEKRVNELEVELSKLSDYVDGLHEALKLFSKSVDDDTKITSNHIEDLMIAISRSTHGSKYDVETVDKKVILTEIPKKPRKLSKKQEEKQMEDLEELLK